MGCDIHAFVEYSKDGKHWQYFCQPNVGRWYLLFSVMAGVRNYDNLTPIVEPRGLPDDTTHWTKSDYADLEADAHTPSWLSTAEMQAVQKRVLESEPTGSPKIYALVRLLESFEEQGLKARLVFWFDN